MLPGVASLEDGEASRLTFESFKITIAPTVRLRTLPHLWNRKIPRAATLAVTAPRTGKRLVGGETNRRQAGAVACAVESRDETPQRLIRFLPSENAARSSLLNRGWPPFSAALTFSQSSTVSV